MPYQLASVLTLLLLLAGCSSVPEQVRTAPSDAPDLTQVRLAPAEAYLGAEVRWGGTINRVDNRQDMTLVEIVARELYRDGEPKQVDTSPGRFIAHINGFLDPAIYASGRRLTVVGRISDSLERELDQMRYRYPVVKVREYHLWPQPVERDDPLYYDPWMYDPWYPWHPWYPGYPWHRYPYYY
ncbi:MAG: Slp family lipoprotein [Gammaproteobacteria bacterium]|nr:Slp family lipoprotein [Gammaproteobacteria bacterium]MCW8841345.1 Slp family lipoprotein [Gammaproteobacteria bacterium]MCW8928053.1 Slp family lipoprotein [Gammaproteobacteria bacterium]MCW8958940.1 Slp family lipoprotein [Gammaproteobacteria bacterium]MCW8973450.1 Slp family lipoprotein [Gammaproteobacteria bacterium]